MSKHHVVEQVKDMIRQPFAFPGGYAKVLIMADGECMCHTCTSHNFRLICGQTKYPSKLRDETWRAHCVDAYWEGPPIHCANCNSAINSEYGDPEAA